jgi:hypothetical protein
MIKAEEYYDFWRWYYSNTTVEKVEHYDEFKKCNWQETLSYSSFQLNRSLDILHKEIAEPLEVMAKRILGGRKYEL